MNVCMYKHHQQQQITIDLIINYTIFKANIQTINQIVEGDTICFENRLAPTVQTKPQHVAMDSGSYIISKPRVTMARVAETRPRYHESLTIVIWLSGYYKPSE